MKTIIRYQCEICKREYQSEQAALDCEARGLPPKYPIGCIYGDHSEGAFYEGITFAVARNRCNEPGGMGHMNVGSSWACRDMWDIGMPISGDSLGEETCAGHQLKLGKYHGNLDPEQPHFKRMVEYLKTLDLPLIYVWDGKKPVPLKAWLEKWRK